MSKEEDFPHLRPGEWAEKSPCDKKYNCVAFTAGRTDVWWWPDEFPDPQGDYWPKDCPRRKKDALEAILALYRWLGYKPCSHGDLEAGYVKVAIFVLGNEPTHTAVQIEGGRWKSKLGPDEDIEHATLKCLEGPKYGKVARFLKKKSEPPAPRPPRKQRGTGWRRGKGRR